jgi:uncharacterized caspase-like protein
MAGKNRAVIVGINKYEDPEIRELRGAETDAQEIRNILTQEGNFEVPDQHFLLGKHATYAAVRAATSDLLWSTEPAGVTLFYFSGHGFQDSYGTGYIAPSDMELERPLVHGIEMQGLRRLALHSPNKQAVVLILDCCYAGIAAEEKGETDPIDTAERCFSDLADIEPPKKKPAGVYVFSSSAKDETSRELAGCEHKLGKGEAHHHGAFSFHLIEGLMGLAGTGHGGEISVAMLRSHIDSALQNRSNQTFKCYESSATYPDRIILARATDVRTLEQDLKRIETDLDAGDFDSLIIAAGDLGRMLKQRPNYEPAKALQVKTEHALKECQAQCREWLFNNKPELMQQARGVCRDLEIVVADMILGGAFDDKRSLSLLFYLVHAVQGQLSVSQLLSTVQPVERTPRRASSSLGTRGSQ